MIGSHAYFVRHAVHERKVSNRVDFFYALSSRSISVFKKGFDENKNSYGGNIKSLESSTKYSDAWNLRHKEPQFV